MQDLIRASERACGPEKRVGGDKSVDHKSPRITLWGNDAAPMLSCLQGDCGLAIPVYDVCNKGRAVCLGNGSDFEEVSRRF